MTMAAQSTARPLAGTGPASVMLRTKPLATTVVGSYSVPEWLGRLKTDYYQRRISAQHLNEIHDVPPVLETLGLAEVEHNARNNRMRAL